MLHWKMIVTSYHSFFYFLLSMDFHLSFPFIEIFNCGFSSTIFRIYTNLQLCFFQKVIFFSFQSSSPFIQIFKYVFQRVWCLPFCSIYTNIQRCFFKEIFVLRFFVSMLYLTVFFNWLPSFLPLSKFGKVTSHSSFSFLVLLSISFHRSSPFIQIFNCVFLSSFFHIFTIFQLWFSSKAVFL